VKPRALGARRATVGGATGEAREVAEPRSGRKRPTTGCAAARCCPGRPKRSHRATRSATRPRRERPPPRRRTPAGARTPRRASCAARSAGRASTVGGCPAPRQRCGLACSSRMKRRPRATPHGVLPGVWPAVATTTVGWHRCGFSALPDRRVAASGRGASSGSPQEHGPVMACRASVIAHTGYATTTSELTRAGVSDRPSATPLPLTLLRSPWLRASPAPGARRLVWTSSERAAQASSRARFARAKGASARDRSALVEVVRSDSDRGPAQSAAITRTR
jgi:hypothetical protein